jgi:glutamate N-acetyltransferase/amino-acid N-acetyltransferase
MATPRHPKPAEIVGQTLEKASDTLNAVLKRAAMKRSDKAHHQVAHAAEPAVSSGAGKPGLKISPLAVDFPVIPPIGGVEIAIGRAGFYKHDRPDLLIMSFAEGTTCAGVFTRHRVGSAPVDWCKRQLEASEGEDIRAPAGRDAGLHRRHRRVARRRQDRGETA